MSYITPFSSDQKVPAGHSDLERGVVPKDGMAPLPASVIWNLPTAVSVLVQGLPDAHLGLGGAGVGDSWWVPRWGAPCLQPGYAVPGSWPCLANVYCTSHICSPAESESYENEAGCRKEVNQIVLKGARFHKTRDSCGILAGWGSLEGRAPERGVGVFGEVLLWVSGRGNGVWDFRAPRVETRPFYMAHNLEPCVQGLWFVDSKALSQSMLCFFIHPESPGDKNASMWTVGKAGYTS